MELNLKATELRLGLPGIDEEKVSSSCSGGYVVRSSSSNKRCSPEEDWCKSNVDSNGTTDDDDDDDDDNVQAAKVQVVGWPPIGSYRKNSMQQQTKKKENNNGIVGSGDGMFVKVSMTGAPYLRKIDLKVYKSYSELLKALQNLCNCTFGEYSEREGYNGSQHVPTYEDKDGDWMLVGDVPFQMFMSSCKRLRIMKGSEAKGLGCF